MPIGWLRPIISVSGFYQTVIHRGNFMGNLYFSPKGRIGPAAFQQAAITLIAISFILNVLPLLSFGLAAILGLVGIILIWPWICIWIKRLHDAGKSGWMLLLILLVMIILSMIASQVVNMIVGVDQAALQEAAMNADGGIMGMFSAVQTASKALILPNAISGAIVGLVIVFGANKLLKSDPEENQYGPAAS